MLSLLSLLLGLPGNIAQERMSLSSNRDVNVAGRLTGKPSSSNSTCICVQLELTDEADMYAESSNWMGGRRFLSMCEYLFVSNSFELDPVWIPFLMFAVGTLKTFPRLAGGTLAGGQDNSLLYNPVESVVTVSASGGNVNARRSSVSSLSHGLSAKDSEGELCTLLGREVTPNIDLGFSD